MKITLTFEVPDGTTFRVEPVAASAEGQYVPPFADELIPLPAEAVPVQGDPVVRGMAHGAPQTGLCPVHHVPWKVVPAGVSKRTGKPYESFAACPERGCDQRPAAS